MFYIFITHHRRGVKVYHR